MAHLPPQPLSSEVLDAELEVDPHLRRHTFHGWQVQPHLPTIQGTLANAIRYVTGEATLPQGSGRTDAGVHALAQIVTVPLEAPIPAANLLRALNRALPTSIRVLAADPVPATFHARHSAIHKTYEYRIFYRSPGDPEAICPPFLAPYVWVCPFAVDPPSCRPPPPTSLARTTSPASPPLTPT